MNTTSIYVAHYSFGEYDENETVVVYVGFSLIDAIQAIKDYEPWHDRVRVGWVSEWVDGKYVQQMELEV